MYSFEYQKAKSVDEAAKIIAKDSDAKVLAGGQSLVATMKLRLSKPSTVVDLGSIKGLSGIKVDSKSVTIGAMTRHAEVAASAEVKKAIPALASLAGGIGDRFPSGGAHPALHRPARGGGFLRRGRSRLLGRPVNFLPSLSLGVGDALSRRGTHRALAPRRFGLCGTAGGIGSEKSLEFGDLAVESLALRIEAEQCRFEEFGRELAGSGHDRLSFLS